MAAAYAALVSLTHVLDNILHSGHHLITNISVDKNLVESLRERVEFLLDFLKAYFHMRVINDAAAALESQIKYAAYAAEDIIEAHIVNKILDPSQSDNITSSGGKSEERKRDLIKKVVKKVFGRRASSSSQGDEISSTDHDFAQGDTSSFIDDFAQGIKKVTECMDDLKKEVMKIQEESGLQIQDKLPKMSNVVGLTSTAPSTQEINAMVGFEDVLIDILDRLTGQQSHRQVIPIFGMAGIGKTTLTRNVYANPVVVQYFDIRAWVAISQEYSVRDILSSLLTQMGVDLGANIGEDRLGEQLHKKLFGMRYLIVMDDIWSTEAWDKVKLFLPDNNNGSRVMMTTRLANVANHFGSCGLEMGFLSEEHSWTLFCKNVFPGEDCPIELECIGKRIVKHCRGLPLSISVIGGFLAKSDKTPHFWLHVAEDVNSIISREDDEHCSKILQLSYSHLPIHLKPCFLYFGFYPEDHEFLVSKLVHIWVAEGFLKPNKATSLEEVAEEHIRDLVDRNLILVGKRGRTGKLKTCSIHDLLRELCLKEIQKDNCLPNSGDDNIQLQQSINRRLFISRITLEKRESIDRNFQSFLSAPSIRSLICDSEGFMAPWQTFRLLRIWVVIKSSYIWPEQFREAMAQFVNSRYLSFNPAGIVDKNVLCSMHRFWNLQTLILSGAGFCLGTLVVPNEIWEMRQLRHIKIETGFSLPNPPASHMDGPDDHIVLENLQTLWSPINFRCTEEVVKRIPNVKKLRFSCYGEFKEFDQLSAFCLNNLSKLGKLESLQCNFSRLFIKVDLPRHLAFPCSLKRLTLNHCNLPWEDMTIIGSLPNLEVLKLFSDSFVGPEWNPNEEEFLRLRVLKMNCLDLQVWTADNTHFPCLQHLSLWHMNWLSEIPLEMADIPTLRSIEIFLGNESIVDSAQKILEERESLGDEDLEVRIN